MTKLLLGLTAALLAGAAFVAGVLVDRHFLAPEGVEAKPAGAAAQPNLNKTPLDPRREAFAHYLDGKAITLKNTHDPNDKGTVHTINKEQIGAVVFPYAMAAVSGEPFQADVTLILTTGEGRYLVRARGPYHQLGEEYFFRAFEVKDVLKQ